MFLILLASAGLMSATVPERTAEPVSDPDGVISTAPRTHQSVVVGATAPEGAEVPPVSSQTITAHDLTTQEQIDRWLSARTSTPTAFPEDVGPFGRDDRKPHGEISAAIGTDDYSAYSMAVSLPIGETGRLNLSYSRSNNDYVGYPGYGYGYGYPVVLPGYGAGFDDGHDRPFGYRDRIYRSRLSAEGAVGADPTRP